MRYNTTSVNLQRSMWLAAGLVAMSALVLPAQAGSLDTTFNSAGQNGVAPGTQITNFVSVARGVAIDSQGRIVAAGFGLAAGNHAHFALARYTPAGVLDTNSFQLSGKVITDFSQAETSVDVGTAVAIDGLGRIVVAGFSDAKGINDFAVARYLADGTLDDTFFNANSPFHGVVLTDFGGNDMAFAVAIDSQGRIVVAGVSNVNGNQDFALARYNPNGALDTTFNANGPSPGLVLTNFSGSSSDVANAVAIDSHGRIVAAGTSSLKFALARYNSDGSADTSFGFNGLVLTDFSTEDGSQTSRDQASALVIDQSDNIVAAGSTDFLDPHSGNFRTIFALARYMASNGQPDPAFDVNGLKTVDFHHSGLSIEEDDQARAAAIDGAGNIVLAGFSNSDDNDHDFAVARLSSSGSLDSFGTVTTDFTIPSKGFNQRNDEAFGMQIDAQGRIVLAGFSDVSGSQNFALARYLGVTADLSLTMMASPAQATVGDTITYTITVKNNGPDAANQVQITDALPASVIFASCSPTGLGSCGGSGNNRTITYSSMAAGSTETITLKATVQSGLANNTVIANTAMASSMTADPNTANNSATANVTEQKRANISLTKTASPSAVIPGDPLTYTLTVSNAGPDDAQTIVVTDTLPSSSVTLVSCSSTGGGGCGGSATVPIVIIPSLAANSSAVITLKVTVNSGLANGTSFDNAATATEATYDPDTANNTAKVTVIVLNQADLSIASSVAKASNRQITYTLTVTNLGPYDARGLVLTNVLPQGTIFGSLEPGAWSCSAPGVGATGTVKCTLGALPATPPTSASASTTLILKVTVPGNTTITDTAVVTASTFDPNTDNNHITFSTRLSGK